MDPVMILDHCNFDVQDRSDGCSLHSLRVGGCKTKSVLGYILLNWHGNT